jgi:hypothetical protein
MRGQVRLEEHNEAPGKPGKGVPRNASETGEQDREDTETKHKLRRESERHVPISENGGVCMET